MSEFELPMTKVAVESVNPTNLIIFSKPKVGKTTIISQLDNCLLLDLENGSRFVEALKVKVESVEDLRKIAVKIKEMGNPYKYVAVDTITALEEICIAYAEELYSKSSMGAAWFKSGGGKEKYGSIINMPNGAGYMWLREAFTKALNVIKTWSEYTILLGHVKDTNLEKAGSEFNTLDLDLTGKIKRIACSKSDAIGYLYRKGDKNILSFKTSDDVGCGARPEHLKNKEIVLSEPDENGKIITHWDEVFIK